MPALSSSNNSVEVHVKTTADNSGLQQVESELGKVDRASSTAASSTGKLASSVALGTAAYEAMRETIGRAEDFLSSSVDQANKYQSSITGLSSVSRVFTGETQNATKAAQELSQDGLMTISDAATGLKNLLASGFSLPQAIQLMGAFKNSAAFNRQETLGFGEAVRTATEGIKNGNSILVDNAGVTKNLSVILQEAGYSAQDLQYATTDAGVRQALFNGILHETVAQQGDAARLADMYAGSQARAGVQTQILQRNVGAIVQVFTGGLISAYSNVLGKNQQMIISLGAGTVAAGILVGGILGVVKAIQLFSIESLIAAATNPLIAALTVLGLLAGVVVYKAMDNLQKQIASTTGSANDMSSALGKTVPQNSSKATKAMGDLQKKLADIDDQIAKNNRDFQQSLADMINSHEQKVQDLTQQLDDENASYAKSGDQKAADFAKSAQEEADAHQKRADAIQHDIDNELALGKWANQQTLRDLQDKMKEENDQYDQSTADKKQSYDQDVADAKASHDSKLTDLQAQLDQENALLTKHAADVASIRNTDLLDEIDKLKQSHNDQLVAFAQQKTDAITNAQQTASGVGAVWDNANTSLNTQFSGLGSTMGTSMGKAFKDALISTFTDIPKDIWNASKPGGSIDKMFDSIFGPNSAMGKAFSSAFNGQAKRASGGPVSAGQPYLVGDNPDGSINPTTEMFIPGQSGTILSAKDTQRALGGGGGSRSVSFTQINHNYSGFDLKQANEEIGYRLAKYA